MNNSAQIIIVFGKIHGVWGVEAKFVTDTGLFSNVVLVETSPTVVFWACGMSASEIRQSGL